MSMPYSTPHSERKKLLLWYEKYQRTLPWRGERDPYKIWISEVMLQQTTSEAVKSYYFRFLKKFPDLKTLAKASLPSVLEMWSGLGYYERARRLHLAAGKLQQLKTFPKTYQELNQLPGFGDYTSRSVASLAFGQPVGVVDGNVIRVFSRLLEIYEEPWTVKGRKKFQQCADSWVQGFSSGSMNQALMELGATLCRTQKPLCFYCPLSSSCKSFQNATISKLPLKRKKPETEYWIWSYHVLVKGKKLALVENDYAPFLKGKLFLPGTSQRVKKKPSSYDFQHSITHRKIFVKRSDKVLSKRALKRVKWVYLNEVKKKNPSSILKKVLERKLSP